MNKLDESRDISFIALLKGIFNKQFGIRYVPSNKVLPEHTILGTSRDEVMKRFFSMSVVFDKLASELPDDAEEYPVLEWMLYILRGIMDECIYRVFPGTYNDFDLCEGFVIVTRQKNREIISGYPFYDSNHPSVTLVEDMGMVFKGRRIDPLPGFSLETPPEIMNYFVAKIDSEIIQSLIIMRYNLLTAPHKFKSDQELLSVINAQLTRQRILLDSLIEYLLTEHIGEQIDLGDTAWNDIFVGKDWCVYSKSLHEILTQTRSKVEIE